MTAGNGPGRETWSRLLAQLDDPPVGTVAEALADARDLDVGGAYDRVEEALAEGVLVEEDDGSAFGAVRVAEEDETPDSAASEGRGGGSPGGDPQGETAETGVRTWGELDFSRIDRERWAPAQIERDAWMCRKESKAPYAPWTDADAPVECNHEDHGETTTCAECSHHAGYKWGSDGSREHVHTDHETAREWAGMVPSLSSDLVYIQREADPFAFVDGDDVRDPETGEIHPAFEAILEHLGVTYADVSTSGGGVHAVYRGEIPLDGVPEAKFTIDTEPWGSNDDPPAVEIYDGKHVCIATGDHVAGSGTEVTEWDDEALAEILRANGYEEREEVAPTPTSTSRTTNRRRPAPTRRPTTFAIYSARSTGSTRNASASGRSSANGHAGVGPSSRCGGPPTTAGPQITSTTGFGTTPATTVGMAVPRSWLRSTPGSSTTPEPSRATSGGRPSSRRSTTSASSGFRSRCSTAPAARAAPKSMVATRARSPRRSTRAAHGTPPGG
ncbi:hypothetical protein GJ633_09015 [Halorubrum sp. CBA1125]|nr:hypothetical protein [Halorubrum sp. CBA1125]